MNDQFIELPEPFEARHPDDVLATLAHFINCDKAPKVEPKTQQMIVIAGKEQPLDMVMAALYHQLDCDKAPNAIYTHRAFTAVPAEEIVVTEQPSLELPHALDIASEGLEGVILVAPHGDIEVYYDLGLVAKEVLGAEISRSATTNVSHTFRLKGVEEWGILQPGDCVSLHEITAGGQFLVIGDFAYPACEILTYLQKNGDNLRVNGDGSPYNGNQWTEDVYQAPPWYTTQSQQGRHAAGLTQQQLDAEQGDLVSPRVPGSATYGFGHRQPTNQEGSYMQDGEYSTETGFRLEVTNDGTGLTDLPREEAEEDRPEAEVYGASDRLHRRAHTGFITGRWFTTGQRWVVLYLGIAAGVLTALAIGHLANPHFGTIMTVTIALLSSPSITVSLGFFGSIMTTEFASEPRFARNDVHAQQILWAGGQMMAWAVLTLADLTVLT